MFSKDRINYIIVFIISLILVLDLFLHSGQPATFDGISHITAIAQFHQALSDGDFPVVWTDKYANYGLPMALVAHQLPNYLGAFLSNFSDNMVTNYNMLLFLAVLLSGLFFYRFLRIYFSPIISLLGTVIFTFAPYKIINIYIRGAMPEVFASIFVPLIFIGIYDLVNKKSMRSVLLLILSFTLLVLTHPMLFVINLFLILPYFTFLFFQNQSVIKVKDIVRDIDYKILVIFFGVIVFSLCIAAFYLIPLFMETKYLVYGREASQSTHQYLSWSNFLSPEWYYFLNTDIFHRGHFIKTGVVEFISLFLGLLVLIYKWFITKDTRMSILEYAVITGFVILFFVTQYSEVFYNHISILAAIQFPWRMLSAFMFIPPIIIAYLLKDVKSHRILILLMLMFALQYLPQLYGKNYTNYEKEHYLFTAINLGQEKNTVWTGKTEDYSIQKQKYAVIEGKGRVTQATVKNSERVYSVEAKSSIRMVDYTFYFPGWNVYVNGKPAPIEFQDPNYRGVITYKLPKGMHEVKVVFEDTKVRLLAKLISIISLIGLPILLYFLNKKKFFKVSSESSF